METFEWTSEQQEDMQGLLALILEYLREHHPFSSLFKEGEILVTPKFASLVVPVGFSEPEDSEEPKVMEKQQAWQRRVRELEEPIKEFLLENLLGSPLYGYFDHSAEHVIVRFGLKPNDILGAERSVTRALDRLNKRYEETAKA